MDETIPGILKKLLADTKYPEQFADAFTSTTISENAVLQSLSQFMLTIISCNSKYDSVISGLKTFTDQEKKGYVLFKKNCASCHTEPLFTNGKFENNGLMIDEDLNDWGRMKISGKQSDSLRFKVPTLRNIEYSYPYMHDGRFKTLGQVLNNYTRGIQHGPTLSPALKKGIYLTPDEKVDMVAFLLTLSDKEFLRDKRFGFH
ncbi:MAG: cytochrome c peroxidase [Chitinophagaceae bacterium]|jgi:cytochrome c peroxidase